MGNIRKVYGLIQPHGSLTLSKWTVQTIITSVPVAPPLLWPLQQKWILKWEKQKYLLENSFTFYLDAFLPARYLPLKLKIKLLSLSKVSLVVYVKRPSISARSGAACFRGKAQGWKAGRSSYRLDLHFPACGPRQTSPPWVFVAPSATKQEIGSDWHFSNLSHSCANIRSIHKLPIPWISKHFPLKSHIVNVFYFVGQTVSVTTTLLSHCHTKAAINNRQANEKGCGPIWLYLQKIGSGPNLASSLRFLTTALY